MSHIPHERPTEPVVKANASVDPFAWTSFVFMIMLLLTNVIRGSGRGTTGETRKQLVFVPKTPTKASFWFTLPYSVPPCPR